LSANPTPSQSLVNELAVFFAGGRGASPLEIDVLVLEGLSQRQLLEAARLLGLTSVSRLKKETLVERLWKAWLDLLAVSPSSGASLTAAASGSAPPHEAKGPGPGQAIAPVPHKFELRQVSAGGTAAPSSDIPWGYGKDRVTAMAVDPDRLFVYWEVTEEALARARRVLGAAAEGAWLNLRLYDTTGRIFDGWNAHSTFDQGIDRGARQWFFTIGKPSSETIAEIGLLARDGAFVKIARSGRVEFPRRDPVAWTEPEWLTVRLENGQVRRAWLPRPGWAGDVGHQDSRGGAAAATGEAPVTGLPVTLPPADVVIRVESDGELVVHRSEWHSEWEEVRGEGVVTGEGEGRTRWEEHAQISSWSEGPFPYPVEVPEPVRETTVGRTRVFRSGARTHVVYGPWKVVIHGLGATRSRSVISRWEVYRSWAEEGGRQVVHVSDGAEGPGLSNGQGASERLLRGASERVWRGGSELRLGGSSELYFVGASELRLGGASERQYLGASERIRKGASERRLGGEAAWARGGASEIRLGGGEERGRASVGGASEARLGGASDYVQRAPAPPSAYPSVAAAGARLPDDGKSSG